MYSFELYCVGTFNFTVTFQSVQFCETQWRDVKFFWMATRWKKAIKHPLP